MRKVLAPALDAWSTTQRVEVFRDEEGRIFVSRGYGTPDATVYRFHPDKMRQDQVPALLRLLVDLLEEQAMIAGHSRPFARFDVELNSKRAAEGKTHGKKVRAARSPQGRGLNARLPEKG